MRKCTLLFLLFLSFAFAASAQVLNYDSLKRVAATTTYTKKRIDALNLLADYYNFIPDSVYHYAVLARDAAAKAGDKGAEAYATANIGMYYVRIGNFVQALSLMFQALKTLEGLKDSARMANTYNGIGGVYTLQGNHAEAKSYYYRCYQLAHSVHDYLDEVFGAQNLARVYLAMNDKDSALYFGKAALATLDREHVLWSRPNSLLLLANIYDQRKQPGLAARYLTEALQSAEGSNDRFLGGIQKAYADKMLRENKLDSALLYAQRAEETINRNNPSIGSWYSIYALLAQIYERKGDFKTAYLYQRKSAVLRDSLYSTTQAQQVANLTFNERQHRLNEQHSQRAFRTKLLLYIALSCVLFLAVLLFYINRSSQRQKQANRLLQQTNKEVNEQRSKAEAALRELRATQQQLIQQEKMASLGELTAGIAHEIQNPLNFVNNFAESNKELLVELKQEAAAGNTNDVLSLAEMIETNEEKIHHHGRRADSIVKSMMEHSRASAFEKQSTNINQLTDEYLKLAYHGFRVKDGGFTVALQTHFDPAVGEAPVLPQDLGRVLLNLFGNAFYAVREKKLRLNGTYEPVVKVSTHREGNAITITVKDNGCGMSEQVVAKVFQPFFTTKPTGEGTGLGLSLSYDIVTKGHGGTLSVESTEGEGAELTVKLPLQTV